MMELKELYELASTYEQFAIKERERADSAWRALELKQKAYDRLIKKVAELEAENDRLFAKTLDGVKEELD